MTAERYVVTTTRADGVVTYRTVATLEEAWMAAEAVCRAVRSAMPKPTLGEIVATGGRPHVPMAREIIRAIGEEGGTLGPLPDGTVIRVEVSS